MILVCSRNHLLFVQGSLFVQEIISCLFKGPCLFKNKDFLNKQGSLNKQGFLKETRIFWTNRKWFPEETKIFWRNKNPWTNKDFLKKQGILNKQEMISWRNKNSRRNKNPWTNKDFLRKQEMISWRNKDFLNKQEIFFSQPAADGLTRAPYWWWDCPPLSQLQSYHLNKGSYEKIYYRYFRSHSNYPM